MCVGVCPFCVRGQRVQRQQAAACVTKNHGVSSECESW